ncbi:hypothetical protein ACOMHN_044215 [Nucella lapillus]
MKTISLKTFGSTAKRRKTKCADGTTIILKADRWLFGRMIVMGQSRNLNMKDLMCFPLGPFPWSLAAPDGTLRKTNKAALATNIKKSAKMAEFVPAHSATIIDGMGLVQRANFDGQQPTFEEVSDRIFSMAVSEAGNSDRLDIVFDTYNKLSIKYNERTNRSVTSGQRIQNIASGQKIKQWRKFLSLESNKVTLIKYLIQEWENEKYFQKLGHLHKVMCVTCEDKCYRFSAIQRREVPELQSFHEEAHGWLILHATRAAEDGYGVVTLSLTSCLPAKTPCGNMHKGQTIKLDCGDAVSHLTLKLQIQCSMDGELKRRVHGLKCTNMCQVKNCDNQPCDDDIATGAASIDEDDEDDE